MYRNPWTGNLDSEIDYSLPAKEIISNCCSLATAKLCKKLRIYDRFIVDGIVELAYDVSVRDIHNWDPEFTLYNFCWQKVRSVYPSVIRKEKRSQYVHLDDYEYVEHSAEYASAPRSDEDEFEIDLEMAREAGITPACTSYRDHLRQIKAETIRKLMHKQ